MRRETFGLDVTPAGNGTGTAQACGDLEDLWVQVSGTFNATVSIEASLNGADFIAIQNTAAPGILNIPPTASHLRITVSGWVSGQPVCMFAGRNMRVL